MTTLIENALIIPMTEKEKTLRSSILIRDGIIAEIGDISVKADAAVDASSMIALPSFVNTHTHLAMVLMRNYKDTAENLQAWLSEIFPIEDKLTDKDIYWASMLGAAELIQSGAATFADMYFNAWNTVKAARSAGIRGVIGQTLFGDKAETRKRFSETVPMIREAMDGSDLFRLDAAPHAVYTCTAETYEEAAAWAKENGARLHTHLSETEKEVEDCLKEHGMRPAEYLESLGVLSVPCYLAHSVHINEGEMDILSSHKDISVVHCPSSNMKLASGVAPLRKFRKRGINAALGTDGASSNNNLSMMKEMNAAAMLATVSERTPSAARPYDILEMATINGARALGLDDRIGTIECGKDADITLIDTSDVNMTPLNDPFSAVIFSADRKNVDSVFCRGERLLAGGKLLTIDKEEAMRKTEGCWAEILSR